MSSQQKDVQSMSQLNVQSLKIVKNVLTLCKSEAINNCLLGGLLTSYVGRTSFYTGIPKTVINELKEKEISKLEEPDPNLVIEIRKILKKFYSQHELPTIEIVFALLQAQKRVACSNSEIFKLQLVELGYENIQLKTTPPSEMLMENPKITFQRYRYLKKLTKARRVNRKIYYLSVKVYNKERKCMITLPHDCKDYLLAEPHILFLYHIVSKDGYEDGLFTYSYDADHLKSWVLNIVGPILEKSSLIILNDSMLYGKPGHHKISSYHQKKEMVRWLKSHNLPCDPNMHKAELFELIEKCSVKREINSVENILKSMGHDVLYLPRFIGDLSPIELFWKYLNNKLRRKTYDTEEQLNDLKQFIVEEISSLSSQGLWAMYDEVVKKTEEDVLALETEIESYLEQCELDLDSFECDR